MPTGQAVFCPANPDPTTHAPPAEGCHLSPVSSTSVAYNKYRRGFEAHQAPHRNDEVTAVKDRKTVDRKGVEKRGCPFVDIVRG